MGAYVSTGSCINHYGIRPNCTYNVTAKNDALLHLGGSAKGQFEGDPDIAGIGVLGAFLAVTTISVGLASASTFWWITKNVLHWKSRISREEKTLRKRKASISSILEELIISCSDQQVFTGGAYAITLRYAKACTVSVYHYNIVSNILLVTCATHLMAVTVSSNYWEHRFVGGLRLAVTSLVYIITGILLSNRGEPDLGFPTKVPTDEETYSFMLLPAACFQTDGIRLGTELDKSFKVGSANEFFNGQVHGWTQFIIMFLFFFLAVVVSVGRLVRRGQDHNGRRTRLIAWFKRTFKPLFRWRRIFYLLFGMYLVAGLAVSSWTVVTSALYVFSLRRWVHESGWMEPVDEEAPDRIAENDPSTFGQLVPVLLISLTLFTFLQVISDRVTLRRKLSTRRKKNIEKHNTGSTTVIQYNGGGPDYPDVGHGSKLEKPMVIGVAVSEPDLDPPKPVDIEAADGRRSHSRSRDGSGSSTPPSMHGPSRPQVHSPSHTRSHSRQNRSFSSPLVPQGFGTPDPDHRSPMPGFQSPTPQQSQSPTPPMQQSLPLHYGSATNVPHVTHVSQTQTPQPTSTIVEQSDFHLPAFDFGPGVNPNSSAQSLPLKSVPQPTPAAHSHQRGPSDVSSLSQVSQAPSHGSHRVSQGSQGSIAPPVPKKSRSRELREQAQQLIHTQSQQHSQQQWSGYQQRESRQQEDQRPGPQPNFGLGERDTYRTF
ncbi:hypothetical protein QBC40DRAFT_89686 [Triangularia verruculosa]|uniref:Uncharacterized protein n=1 Tax=Triangularia verruculosa TaxID=2587418 RepID=A0AAN6XHS0_9PEZI|nr:hypothetical protein QBC40DRAFT_89686 [Triangularia verruculosa]